MRKIINYINIIICLLIILFISAPCEAFTCKFKVDKLDCKVITNKLPLKGKEITKSGNGRIKQRWTIKTPKKDLPCIFESIGNNQRDADKMAWNCAEFDSEGARIKPLTTEYFCHKFFIKVLNNVVDCPEELSRKLILQGERTNPQSARYDIINSDISIETDGEFYFLRRKSRMGNDLKNY